MKEVKPGFENEAYFSRFFKVNRFQSGRIHKKIVHQNLWFVHFLDSGTLLL